MENLSLEKLIETFENEFQFIKSNNEVRTDNDKTLYQREIDRLDNEIDRLVYKLYELTDDEIAIVEESVKR